MSFSQFSSIIFFFLVNFWMKFYENRRKISWENDINIWKHLMFLQWTELFILCLLQHKLLPDIFIVMPPSLSENELPLFWEEQENHKEFRQKEEEKNIKFPLFCMLELCLKKSLKFMYAFIHLQFSS